MRKSHLNTSLLGSYTTTLDSSDVDVPGLQHLGLPDLIHLDFHRDGVATNGGRAFAYGAPFTWN